MFCDLTGYDRNKIGTAPAPFIDESKDPLIAMQEATEPPAKARAPSQPTQGGNHRLRTRGVTGELSHIATKCLVKIMYVAGFARQDFLRATGALATMITKWVEACDRKQLRITRYINGTVAWRQIGFIGDSPDQLQLGLFPTPTSLETGPT